MSETTVTETIIVWIKKSIVGSGPRIINMKVDYTTFSHDKLRFLLRQCLLNNFLYKRIVIL